MKTKTEPLPTSFYDAVAWHFRKWWGVNAPQSVAMTDVLICTVIGIFPFVMGWLPFWQVLGSLFLIGAAVRTHHVWIHRPMGDRHE